MSCKAWLWCFTDVFWLVAVLCSGLVGLGFFAVIKCVKSQIWFPLSGMLSLELWAFIFLWFQITKATNKNLILLKSNIHSTAPLVPTCRCNLVWLWLAPFNFLLNKKSEAQADAYNQMTPLFTFTHLFSVLQSTGTYPFHFLFP